MIPSDLTWNRYIVRMAGWVDRPVMVAWAPNEGSAVEYYLASHGLFGYDYPMVIQRTYKDFPTDNTRERVFRILFGEYPSEKMVIHDLAELQSHHIYQIVDYLEREVIENGIESYPIDVYVTIDTEGVVQYDVLRMAPVGYERDLSRITSPGGHF